MAAGVAGVRFLGALGAVIAPIVTGGDPSLVQFPDGATEAPGSYPACSVT